MEDTTFSKKLLGGEFKNMRDIMIHCGKIEVICIGEEVDSIIKVWINESEKDVFRNGYPHEEIDCSHINKGLIIIRDTKAQSKGSFRNNIGTLLAPAGVKVYGVIYLKNNTGIAITQDELLQYVSKGKVMHLQHNLSMMTKV